MGSKESGGALPPASPDPTSFATDALSTFTQTQKNSAELRLDVAVDEAVENLISNIVQDPVYHGSVKLSDMSDILVVNGDFAVRIPENQMPAQAHLYVVVRWNGEIREFPFKFLPLSEKERLVTLNGNVVKSSIKELMLFHVINKIPLDKDVLLITRVARPIWEVPKSSVTLETKIGEGAFGSVWSGKLQPEKPGKPPQDVAVKVTKVCEENKAKMEEMLVEARLMRQLQHVNVVAFLGMISDGGEVMIVMELVTGGSIDNYVKNNKVSVEDKSSFCSDIALGLFYLHSRRYIHRDVAARNCLIDVATTTVKISDFGMSKQGENYKIQATERTPIRWQAPEVLRTALYTRECDVYSFGMTMYEIFSNGQVPFAGIPNKTIRARLQEPSFRPDPAPETPAEIKALMLSAWDARPEIRITMRMACQILTKYRKNRRKPAVTAINKESSKKGDSSSRKVTRTRGKAAEAKAKSGDAPDAKAGAAKESNSSKKVKRTTRETGRTKKGKSKMAEPSQKLKPAQKLAMAKEESERKKRR